MVITPRRCSVHGISQVGHSWSVKAWWRSDCFNSSRLSDGQLLGYRTHSAGVTDCASNSSILARASPQTREGVDRLASVPELAAVTDGPGARTAQAWNLDSRC